MEDAMNQDLSALLEDLYRGGRAHDEGELDRLKRWRNVEPDTARLMSILVRALTPRRLLELGTSNGYSTIWLAEAARATGGLLTSVEIEAARSASAGENLRRAGLAAFVNLRVADADEVLAASDDHSWDFIFLDAERPAYVSYWPHLRRVLAPRGLLIVDNVISHAREVADFQALIAADEGLAGTVVPIGAGPLLVVHEPNQSTALT
jgi:predicted O-methyltransferase YrrM